MIVELKTAGEIEAMAAAGAVVAECLAAARAAAVPGASTADLDAAAAAVMAARGATPAFRGYHPGWAPTPFPGVVCVSVDDAVVHGIPRVDAVLRDGDLVSIDCGAFVDGWCGDAAVSVIVGTPAPADVALVAATERALAAGIEAARPGGRMGDIGAAIDAVARAAGVGNLDDHGGHGIGRAMHEAPSVPNVGRRGEGLRLVPGLVIAIEPMFLAGGSGAYRHDADGWTIRSRDGSRAAHAEHTVAITPTGPRVLTERG